MSPHQFSNPINGIMLYLLRTTIAPAALLTLFAAAGWAQTQALNYPATRRGSTVDTLHGTVVPDPYRWLEDANSSETRAWIEAQNRLTNSHLASLPGRDSIQRRLTQLWDYPKYSAPTRARNRYFFLENSGVQNQPALHVQDGLNGRPRALVDPNALSSNGTVALSVYEPSPNANLLAYGVSVGGSDWQEFRVRDVRRGTDLSDTLRWVKFSGIAWTRDSEGFFYSRYAEPQQGEELTGVLGNQKLYFHRIGTPQSEDVLILERPDDPDLGFDVELTTDGQFAVITVWRGTDPRNLVYAIDLAFRGADRVTAPIVRLVDEFKASFQLVGGDTTSLYFLTDYRAPLGRIIHLDVNRPGEEFWTTVVRETANRIERAEMASYNRIVVSYLRDAHSMLSLYTMNGVLAGTVPLPGHGTVSSIESTGEYDEFFYTFTSFLAPTTVFRYDVGARSNEPYRAPTVDFPLDQYETRQVFATSKDGTRIPIFVTLRKGAELNGTHPLIMYGYGGFDISLTPSFSPWVLAWLEMGGVYASVNTRGGGEYGREWHAAGTLLQKQNVFDDFIAAGEFLITQGYTSTSRLALLGGSNGGLLVGAIMTQRPDLAAVALPAVGVMDMLRFHKFTIGRAWVSDFGSPDNPEQFAALRAYSPLHNLRPGTRYPATLITTADHADRVVAAHSFKFAAALQAAHAGTAPVLIRIETEAGHGAGMPTSKRIQEWADRLAFARANMEIREQRE